MHTLWLTCNYSNFIIANYCLPLISPLRNHRKVVVMSADYSVAHALLPPPNLTLPLEWTSTTGIMLDPSVRGTLVHHYCIKKYFSYKLLHSTAQTTIKNYTYLTWQRSSTEVLHDLTVDSVIRGYHIYKWRDFVLWTTENEENRFAVAGHQLSKYLGTFNWKIWLARRTSEQITINSLKGAK